MPEEKNVPPRQQQAERQQAGGEEDLRREVRDLKNALASLRATVPTSLIPLHGAGPGEDIDETWSLAEQEEARAADR
jgi:hypothetical protein